MKCTQRLYLTEGKAKLVGEGDKKAATLYAVPGDEIPESAAERFGLVDGHLKGFDPTAATKDKEPEQQPPTTVVATQTLYHSSASPDALVGEGDPAAGALYANVGDEIPLNAHDGFGLVDGHLADFDPNAAAKEDKAGSDKEQKSGSDKEQKPGSDKTESGEGQADAVSGDAKA